MSHETSFYVLLIEICLVPIIPLSDSHYKVAKMSLDLYTRNIPLAQKARFWGNYVSALKGKLSHTMMSQVMIMRSPLR